MPSIDGQPDIGDFAAVTQAGHQAKRSMLEARTDAAFVPLLVRYPRDGMLYFLRAEAFEELDQRERAHIDFALAEHLFPMDHWKSRAAEGKARTAAQAVS